MAFNREISLGHLLTAGTMILTGVLSYAGLMSNVRLMEHRISLLEKSWDNKKPSDMELSNFIIQTDTRLNSVENLNRTQDARLNMLEIRIGKELTSERVRGE